MHALISLSKVGGGDLKLIIINNNYEILNDCTVNLNFAI